MIIMVNWFAKLQNTVFYTLEIKTKHGGLYLPNKISKGFKITFYFKYSSMIISPLGNFVDVINF